MHAEREKAAVGACGLTDHSQGTHVAARHLTRHTRCDDYQAGNGPRRTDPPTLAEA